MEGGEMPWSKRCRLRSNFTTNGHECAMNTRHKKPGRSRNPSSASSPESRPLTQTIEPVQRDTCKSTPKTAEVFVADNFLRLLAAFVLTALLRLTTRGFTTFFVLAGRSRASPRLARMLLRGLALGWRCCGSAFVNVFEHQSFRVLVLHLGDQGIAVHVLPLAEVSRLEWCHYEHRQNIEDLLKQGIRPGLDGIRKHGDVLKTSRHTDIRTEAQWAETFRHRQYHNVDLLIPEIDVAFTGNDRIGGIENQSLNAHLSILSLEI